MTRHDYAVNPGWMLVLKDLSLNPEDVLRRAGLPPDVLLKSEGRLSIQQMFAIWEAMEDAFDGDSLAIAVSQALTVEGFSPVLFAATCSPDLLTAVRRLAHHKPLIGPMRIDITESTTQVTLTLRWPDGLTPPRSLALAELGFPVRLARLGTREPIRAVAVGCPNPPADQEPYISFFGTRIQETPQRFIAFSGSDVQRPFLTANEAMWHFFEPELRNRLGMLRADSSTSERVRACLLEQLPAGSGTVGSVARQLAMSPRTLQRRLRTEGTGFQSVLDSTREALARHYLTASDLPTDEIAFLLGYDETRSFHRAFRQWTGQTPAVARLQAS